MKAMATNQTVNEANFTEAAEKLSEVLTKRSDEANLERNLPQKTVDDFHEAGFFRMLQPSHWQGYETSPQAFFDTVIRVAEACPSSAWVLGVVGVHQWQMGLFAPEAQEEVWGNDPTALISSSYMPAAQVEIVSGGYKISGRWGFSSGSPHCQWTFLGGFVPPSKDTDVPEMRTFLLPRADYFIEDDWFTSGLKATGSRTIVVDGAFVPEHRTHKMSDGFRQESPGHQLNTAPLFRLPFGQIFTRSVATPAIGMAKGALRAYQDVTSIRKGRADGQKVVADPRSKEVCAQAALAIDEAITILHRDYDELMAYAESSTRIPMDDRVRYRYNAATATDKCTTAVRDLFITSGGQALFLNSKINHFFQDIHAARAHYANNPYKSARNYGGVMMGQKTTDWFI